MRKKVLSFLTLIKGFIKKIKNFYTKVRDRREERPQVGSLPFTFFITLVISVVLTLWIQLWFPYINTDTARWVLSAQVQATAAIFGLLIAAMAFWWRTVTNQEQQLRSNIYSYLKTIGRAKSGTIPPSLFAIQLGYEKYLDWINVATAKNKKMDKAFINLGRLWVIKELSFIHISGGAKEFSRYLKHGQTKQLSKISKLSKESAIEMWESYYKNSAQFILDMYEALGHIHITLSDLETTDSNEDKVKQSAGINFYEIFSIVSQILADGSKLIAEEIKRRRSISKPFYFTSVILTLSIVIGLLILTGISNTNPLLNLNPNVIRWVVGIPIGLSVYGVSLCLLLIRSILG